MHTVTIYGVLVLRIRAKFPNSVHPVDHLHLELTGATRTCLKVKNGPAGWGDQQESFLVDSWQG